MTGYTDFGLEIRQQLLLKGKNLTWLSKEIGCSTPHLSEMLRGTRDISSWKEKIKEVMSDDKDSGTSTT